MGEFSWAYISGGAGSGPEGSIQVRDNAALSGTSNFTYDFDTDLLALTGSMEISGTLTANQYNINVVDKTVTNISASGDTKFGDTPDDTHQFTGSVFVSSSIVVTGSGRETTTTINGTHVSSSLNISGSSFYGDGSNLSGISPEPAGLDTQLQFNNSGDFGASSNLTFVSNQVRITGSLAVSGSARETTTTIDGTHISSSLNISGSAFYGDGSNLTNLSAAGADRQIQFNDSGDFGGSANLVFRADGEIAVTGSLVLTGSGQSLITLNTRDADNLKEIVFNKDGSAAAAIQINSAEHLFIENENTKDIILRANNQNALRVLGAERRVLIGSVSKTTAAASLDVEGGGVFSGSVTISGSSTIGNLNEHVATVGGQLTASQGITLGESAFIASNKNIVLGSSGDSVIQYNTSLGKLIISGSLGGGGIDLQGGEVTIDFPGGTIGSGSIAGAGSYLGLDSGNKLVLTASSASPAGANTQVQFNNNGSLGGSANFTFDSADSELEVKGNLEVVSGSDATGTTVFQVDSSLAPGASGSVRGRMLHTIITHFDLASGAQARTGRYISLTNNSSVGTTLTRLNGFISPFSGRLISINYHFPASATNQDQSKGQCGFALRTADINTLNGNSMDSAVSNTSFVTASTWPGTNRVGSINVQTGDGALGGLANVTGTFSFGTGSAVGLFFQSGDSSGVNFPGQAAFTLVFELDQLNPLISGSGN